MKYFCNPLNIDYKYQHFDKPAHRETADPTLIHFKGKYYIFSSMCGGFYYSDDMIDWKWHENRNIDIYHYAPDVRQVGEYLVLCASDVDPCTFWRTLDPLSDKFEKVSEPFDFWDPDLFIDDDGKAYFYWGCNCMTPIWGQEFDPEKLVPIGEKKELFAGKYFEHGFERKFHPGDKDYKRRKIAKLERKDMRQVAPYIEGAFMTKYNGKYYLQYAGPGTEFTVYGDGVYVSDNPMGPFEYQSHNPFSLKPGGYINGAGHGSTIFDEYGNLWHAATMGVCANAPFERRIGLFPAGFDKDGILFCNQNFADWAYQIPEGKFDPTKIKPEWMMVSYKKSATVSGEKDGYGKENALDENIQTSWCSGAKDGWYCLDLENTYDVKAIQINFADVEVPTLDVPASERSKPCTACRYVDTAKKVTRWLLEGSVDGKEWFTVCDKREADTDLAHDCIFADVKVRYLKLTVTELPYDKMVALNGFRVFALPFGVAPAKVTTFRKKKIDDFSVKLKWKSAENAIGYNVRFGIAPDKLYSSHMVYGKNEVIISTLNKGQKYYYCVDSFGEGGITEGEVNL